MVAQDDDSVVHPENSQYPKQDACEVYIDGDHSVGDDTQYAVGAQQYYIVPQPGTFNRGIQDNPAISGGDILKAGLQGTCLRSANITTYEWSIPLFEHYPDRRLRIEPNKKIGFDVNVIDADGEENGNWVAWTPEGGKNKNSDLLGDLVFVENYQYLDITLEPVIPASLLRSYGNLCSITGTVTTDKVPCPGLSTNLFWATRTRSQ